MARLQDDGEAVVERFQPTTGRFSGWAAVVLSAVGVIAAVVYLDEGFPVWVGATALLVGVLATTITVASSTHPSSQGHARAGMRAARQGRSRRAKSRPPSDPIPGSRRPSPSSAPCTSGSFGMSRS